MTLIEKLAPYLPYGLKCLNQHLPDDEFIVEELIGIQNHIGWCGVFNARHGSNYTPISAVKPILRPLSDLNRVNFTYQIIDSDGLYYGDILRDFEDEIIGPNMLCYNHFQVLLKYHYDVFGMIEDGLAININDL